MDNGFIMLWRKAKKNGIMKDHLAWTLFCWILMSVDRNTGAYTTGRFILSKELDAKPTTVYAALQRLKKKYKVVDLVTGKVTIKYTKISVLNWDKYQNVKSPMTQSDNNSMTIHRQSNDTKQEGDKGIINNNKIVLLPDAKVPSQEIKVYKRLPLEKQTVYYRVCYFYEDTMKTNIVNFPKQFKAIKMMLKAGYNEKQILYSVKVMARDEFYEDKGFDLMTVSNNIAQIKAQARKEVGKSAD